jgi:hypothetical protein
MPQVDGKNVLVFAPQYNTAGKKADATGAFQPEAQAFARHHGVPKNQVVYVDNTLSKREMRQTVLGVVAAFRQGASGGKPPDAVAFFCHGQGKRIQFGFDTTNVADLAKAMTGIVAPRVALYACNTGKASDAEALAAFGGDGGFADALRDALCQAGATECQVDAHTTAGHTTMNPNVRRFQGMGSPVGGVGGFYIVHPKQKNLWKKWRTVLRETNLRFDFPFMSVAEIHKALT